jgi:two-component system sensor histidine kinase KdpD
VVDDADEVEVVDISPQALRARMRHGNIYPPAQAEQALTGFFREGNLAALRDLVLKRVAHEVEQDLQEYMHEHGLEGWEADERCLVLIDNTPAAEVALRRAWRMASAFHGSLIAAYSARLLKESGMMHILTVAMDLNASLKELPGMDLPLEIIDLIQLEHVVHVTLVAAPSPMRVLRVAHVPLGERLLHELPHIDLHLVSPERGKGEPH